MNGKRLMAKLQERFDIAVTRYSTLKRLRETADRIGDPEGIGVEAVRASVFKYHLRRATGVLHLGAHLGEEAEVYRAEGKSVVWVEAIPSIHSRLCRRLADFPGQVALCALLSDRDGEVRSFNISSNADGASSSIYEFGEYATGPKSLWPELELRMTGSLALPTARLDTLLRSNQVDASRYDMWVVDLQGAELLALQGSGDLLDQCRSVQVEVSLGEVYKGGVLWDELERFLSTRGFSPLWRPLWRHDEVLFVR